MRIGGLVVTRQHPMTARGTVFLALEDETGMVNVTLWPDTWQRLRGVVRRHALLLVEGDLQREANVVNVDRAIDVRAAGGGGASGRRAGRTAGCPPDGAGRDAPAVLDPSAPARRPKERADAASEEAVSSREARAARDCLLRGGAPTRGQRRRALDFGRLLRLRCCCCWARARFGFDRLRNRLYQAAAAAYTAPDTGEMTSAWVTNRLSLRVADTRRRVDRHGQAADRDERQDETRQVARADGEEAGQERGCHRRRVDEELEREGACDLEDRGARRRAGEEVGW